MRALRGRQAALLALQQDAESKLATTRQKSNEGIMTKFLLAIHHSISVCSRRGFTHIFDHAPWPYIFQRKCPIQAPNTCFHLRTVVKQSDHFFRRHPLSEKITLARDLLIINKICTIFLAWNGIKWHLTLWNMIFVRLNCLDIDFKNQMALFRTFQLFSTCIYFSSFCF
jgi:hypothetical protein